MAVVEVENIECAELRPYASLTEKGLRSNPEDSMLIAESPKVIATALKAGLIPVSLLCERKHITGDAASIIEAWPGMPVYTASREVLASLTGYTLTRGVLCAMRRPELPAPEEILKDSERVVVIYDVCDTTNVGAIFRSAAALGIGGIILSPRSCDPFNRRSIRVSMGTVFQIPWSYDGNILQTLERSGFRSVSLALRDDSVALQEFKIRKGEKYALILGSEGYGLPAEIIESSDTVVRIPMARGVDSLNVGAAAAIAIWHFCAGI